MIESEVVISEKLCSIAIQWGTRYFITSIVVGVHFGSLSLLDRLKGYTGCIGSTVVGVITRASCPCISYMLYCSIFI